ncbi:MAG: molybdenum cofactor guanylyltransferase [Deltaproteobacteria bacterium]|nr:MAG: molybdenum cofactor guanylyltransferase [Deltaproteobacteria bacterium]
MKGRIEGVSAAVLAGGASSRMGRNKALLTVPESGGGETIIARTCRLLSRRFAEVQIIGGVFSPLPPGASRLVADRLPGKGPLGGLYTAFCATRAEGVFLTACDMPFISEGVIDALLEHREVARAQGKDAVVARIEGRWQPLLALYFRSALAPLEALLSKGNLRFSDFLDRIALHAVAEDALAPRGGDLRSFFNLNTPYDLEIAQRLAQDALRQETR